MSIKASVKSYLPFKRNLELSCWEGRQIRNGGTEELREGKVLADLRVLCSLMLALFQVVPQ
jgi:hypothetical protein